MPVETLDELFEHELEDIYYAEHELLDVLEELADQTENEAATTAFQDHHDETREHIDRLEDVFEMIGEPPEEEECEGIQGLVQEHEDFVENDPSQAVLDVFNLTSAQKTEHYEIAAYENLVVLANQLGMDDAGDLLHQNLREEEQTLDELRELTTEFDYEQVEA